MSFVTPSNHCCCVWRCKVVMLLLWSRFCKSWERGREGGGERGGPEEPAVTRTPVPCLHSWKLVSDIACNTDWIMCITLPPPFSPSSLHLSEMARLLVAHGADVNLHGDSDSWTPLSHGWLVGLWLSADKDQMSKYSQSNSLSLLVAMLVTRQWSSSCCLLERV